MARLRRTGKREALLNYKDQLEQAAQAMVLVHDPEKLIREIVEMLVQKVELKHAAALICNKEKGTYLLTVSGGEKGLRIPEGYTRLDPTSALIYLFTTRKNYLFDKNGIITYNKIKQLLKDNSLLNQEKGLSEIILAAKKQMELYRISVCLPVYVRNKELLGTLMLGDKRSDKEFSKEELSFFVALASNIAMAIRNAQLHEFEVKAEKLAGITNLLDGLSHEFRNQIGTVEFFMDNYDRPEYQEEMKNYRKSARIAFDNITSTLKAVYLYRLACDRKEIKLTDIKDSINNALSLLKEEFNSIDAKITTKISDGLPKIETYPTFEYLFINLFRNCYFALAQRKTRLLKIKACKGKDSQRPVELVITDTGGNMPKVIKENISSGGEYFPERANIGGVFFFLAKHIIDDHNGELLIEPNPPVNEQEGTIFTIRLPLQQPKTG